MALTKCGKNAMTLVIDGTKEGSKAQKSGHARVDLLDLPCNAGKPTR